MPAKTSLLGLPAELRNVIYRIVLTQTDDYRRSSLKQPALTRVNKQIRSESLTVFYGENGFHVGITSNNAWISYQQWVRRNSTKLHLVRNLTVIYEEPVGWDISNFLLGFDVIADMENVESFRHAEMIGSPGLNWNNNKVVRTAYKRAMHNAAGEMLEDMEERIPVGIERVVKALRMIAKQGALANKYVQLVWNYGH